MVLYGFPAVKHVSVKFFSFLIFKFFFRSSIFLLSDNCRSQYFTRSCSFIIYIMYVWTDQTLAIFLPYEHIILAKQADRDKCRLGLNEATPNISLYQISKVESNFFQSVLSRREDVIFDEVHSCTTLHPVYRWCKAHCGLGDLCPAWMAHPGVIAGSSGRKIRKNISVLYMYSRGYKKRALSGEFFWTLNERKTYFEINFIVYFNRLW